MAAGRNIKGITIEIGGDTTGLQKALSGVNDRLKNTQTQLKDVNTLLKLDPSNTVLVAQKQELLKNAIADTADKLDTLEAAQKDVTAALEAGKIGQEEYMAFQREVEETKATLGRYQSELDGLNTEQERLATNTERLSKLFDALGTDVDDYADVLGSKLVTAIKNGSASSDQLKTAIEKIGKSAAGGRVDIKQLTDALDTVDDGQAVQNLIDELKRAGEQADSTSDQLDDMGKTLAGGLLAEAADQLSGLGDKITELGEKAKDAFLETQDATAKASVYFGETGKAAEETARVIKNVYAEGVGESMDYVADAVIMVKKNLGELDETTLTHLTEQAITLDQLYGIDMNETLRGVNSLMKQYGLTAQEAMNYIVAGTQNGLDKTNELGDNLSEYAGKFAQAGYSAQEYFQLLQNGLAGGAYNLDKVNDAINEVTTRLTDGTIEDSLSKINEETGELEAGTGNWGQEVEDTFKEWKDGRATQKQVVDAIVKDIKNTGNQQEKLNKAALAFGTMAEDGNAKFVESLTAVGHTYDDVSGAASNMFDQSTTESQIFESSMRQLEQSLVPLGESLMRLANEIIPPLASKIQQIGEFFGNLPEPVQNFVIILGTLIAVFAALAPAIAAVSAATTALNISLLPIIAVVVGVAAAIAGIVIAIQNWGAVTEWFGNLWSVVKEKCAAVWTAICTFFTETIPQAWDILVAKFQTIPEWWSGIWQQVSEFFSTIWTAICTFFTETIPQAWDILVAKFQTIPEWWSGIWQQVSEFFSDTWTAMMENPVLTEIITTIQTLWNNCVTTLQGIWDGLVQIASGAWELLKNTILAPIVLLMDLVTGDFEKLSTDASTIWTNMQEAASTIWSGIQEIVTSLAEGIVTTVTTSISGFRDTLLGIWSGIEEGASTAWQNIKDFVVRTAGDLKEDAVQAFGDLVTGIGKALGGLGGVVSKGFDSAIDFITGLPKKALGWGKDFVNGIADGIRGAINNVADAAAGVASAIRSFLHFSVPDVGPLTEYESWMPDFMQGLAKGIDKNKSVVTDAIAGVSKDMSINAEAMVGQSSTKQNDAVASMTSLLAQYLPYLAKGLDIKWNTGSVAAHLARDMDRELGILAEEGGFL